MTDDADELSVSPSSVVEMRPLLMENCAGSRSGSYSVRSAIRPGLDRPYFIRAMFEIATGLPGKRYRVRFTA
jgi:hypothetical protein